jgi:hypothetical protein
LLGIVARVRIRAYPAVCIEFLVTFPWKCYNFACILYTQSKSR